MSETFVMRQTRIKKDIYAFVWSSVNEDIVKIKDENAQICLRLSKLMTNGLVGIIYHETRNI